MSRRNRQLPSYKDRAKELRRYFTNFDPSYIDLRKKLTPAQKAKITRYWNDLNELREGHFKKHPIYNVKDENKKKRIQQSVHQGSYYSKYLKYVLVPVSSPTAEVHIRTKRDGTVTVKSRGVTRYYVPINFNDLVMNRKQTIQEILDDNPNIKRWFISAGNHEIHRKPDVTNMPPDADYIDQMLELLMQQYGADKYDPENPSSKFFGNWLNGLIGYQFTKTASYEEYQRAKRIARQRREALRQEIKNNKRAIRYMQEYAARGVSYENIAAELKRKGWLPPDWNF